jgi:uncharacterized lipoprotein YddW (UPF0748 family)
MANPSLLRIWPWALALLAATPSGCARPKPPPEPEVEVVHASHQRELRAIWVATVANIDFPSKPGLSTEDQRRELHELVDLIDEVGLNAIMFQVRPEGDALYRSELEPWSRFLTGTQGQDPGWDPLEELVELAHARNIEVHAWFNPYRAASDRRKTTAAPHVSVTHPDWTVAYGAHQWMDPGREEVRQHTTAVVRDVVERYDVDGVHFDDYFYPYPNGTPFPDAATYKAYQDGGGTLDKDDWRRANVNALVADVYRAVKEVRPSVQFGISPFGIYRPGQPEGIRGMDQVDAIYADPLSWVEAGNVDYLAPQLYWPTTQKAQAHEPLLDWWAAQTQGRTRLYIGNYLSQVGVTPAWTTDELTAQRTLAADHPGVSGNIWFSARPLLEDRHGVRAMMRGLYPSPALPPVRVDHEPERPIVEVDGGELCMQHHHVGGLRSFVVYGEAGNVLALVPAGAHEHLRVPSGRYVVTAAEGGGMESVGVAINVPGVLSEP